MMVFITKYALTQGILEKDVTLLDSGVVATPGTHANYFHKGEWYKERVEAIKDARLRKDRKISSIKKQIKRIEDLTFEA